MYKIIVNIKIFFPSPIIQSDIIIISLTQPHPHPTLSLSWNNFGDKGAISLAKPLGNITNLKELSLK
jgi:hypothetical protein